MLDQICRVCGCTDYDCTQCIEKTGEPCYWIEPDLCSACIDHQHKYAVNVKCSFLDAHGESHKITFDTVVTPGNEPMELQIICMKTLGEKGFKIVSIKNISYEKR